MGAVGRVQDHPMALTDPALLRLVGVGLVRNVVARTRRSYTGVVRGYDNFCRSRRLQSWPVDEVVFSAWIQWLCLSVKVSSLRMYISAVKDFSRLHESGWHLDDSDVIHRTLRFVKRSYPCDTVAVKYAVTLPILRRMAGCLPLWPLLDGLLFSELLWLTASVIAVCAFLRGGEFATSPSSDRRVLLASDISIRVINDRETLVVSVPQPKTRVGCRVVDVPCFVGAREGPMSPLVLWRKFRQRVDLFGVSPGPAFPMNSGAPMSRAFITSFTSSLLSRARIPVVDSTGRATSVKMASWRAGAVSSATAAGLSEAMIMELGRWRSNAWRHYLLHSPLDLQGAGLRMWSVACSSEEDGAVLRMGAGDTLSLGGDGDAVVAAKVRKMVVLYP
jgi:hypothetical protein